MPLTALTQGPIPLYIRQTWFKLKQTQFKSFKVGLNSVNSTLQTREEKTQKSI